MKVSNWLVLFKSERRKMDRIYQNYSGSYNVSQLPRLNKLEHYRSHFP
jgi:hypothetical protein